jgi:hypothetical protein
MLALLLYRIKRIMLKSKKNLYFYFKTQLKLIKKILKIINT